LFFSSHVSILCPKVLDATSEEEFQVLPTDDEFMNVFSLCGDTSMLKVGKIKKSNTIN
jgi:hypothetical protein